MVSHIIERITQSQNIKKEQISCAAIRNGTPNKFYVQSKSYGKEYLLFINDEDGHQNRNNLWKKAAEKEYHTSKLHQTNANLPYCECPDWKKFQLPCKHILAVFTFYNCGWNNFPKMYKNSPYFTVDYDFIDERDCSQPAQNNIVDNSENELIQGDDDGAEVHLIDIPKKQYPKRTIASNCREMLKELKDLTYVVRDLESFEILEEELSTILEAFRKEAPSDDGLLLENKPFKKPSKKEAEISNYGPLPIPKKLKSKFTGRVGRANEADKLHRNINVKIEKTKDQLTIEEPVAVNDMAKYDHPVVLSDDDDDFNVPVSIPVADKKKQVKETKISG